jgi:hypothetical protein
MLWKLSVLWYLKVESGLEGLCVLWYLKVEGGHEGSCVLWYLKVESVTRGFIRFVVPESREWA